MPTVTVLNTANRQGTVTSASLRVPAVAEEVAVVEMVVSNQDMNDPATVVTARLYASADEGATWTMFGGGMWVGGPSTEKNGAPREWKLNVTEPARFAGQLARVELDLPAVTRIGVRVSV
jgi:hypothetical protein